MALEDVVIAYRSDISDIVRNAKQITTINQKLAQQIGIDLSKGFTLVNQELSKVQFNKTFKIRTDEGLKKVTGDVSTFTKTIQTADGQVIKFNEVIGSSAQGTQVLGQTLVQVSNAQTKLIGQSSTLTTNFAQVSDITNKFSKQLQGFGSITNVVSSELSKTKDNVKQVNTVVQDANGQFLKLTETTKLNAKGIQEVSRSVQKIQSPFKSVAGSASQLATNFSNLGNINRTFASQLGQVGNVSKFVGTSLKQVSNDGSKTAVIFETVNGKFVKLTQTVSRTPDGIQKVSRSVQELSRSQVENTKTLENSTKRSESFRESLVRLGKRALLTIPIWFALRNSIFGVFRTISDGLKNLAEFDRALQKLGRNLEASTTNFNADFQRIQQTVTEFSLQTGKSVEEITNAIQKFATVGFDLETSLTGGLQSTKLAITLFGDVEETAQAFARSLRVLTEDIDGTEAKQKAIAEALALTDQLWQTNAFEVNEFSNNLEKFAGTANIANLSIEDTLTLLATLSTGGLGNRAGRLLRTTLLRSLSDIEKVTRALNLQFDPNKQPTIEFILLLIDRLKELRTVDKVPAELAEILGDLFSVRSTEVIASLVSLEETLKENIALRPDIEKFEDTFKEQLQTINRLVERHKNLNKEMGKAFVTGLLGAGNYQKALETLVKFQQQLNKDMERFGNIIRDALLVTGIAGIVGFRKQLISLLALLQKPVVLGAVAGFTVLNFKAEAEKLAREAEATNQKFNEIGESIVLQINKGLRGKLSLDQLDELIAKIEVIGASNLGFDSSTIDRTLELLKEILSEQEKISKESEKQLNIDKQKEISQNRSRQISELVLQNELEILKSRGATESQLIEAEQKIRSQFGIEKEINDQLIDQLNKQREINKEKELGNTLTSRTQKLFEIAQTEGTETARRISEVLRGQRDFNTFIRQGGKDVEVFRKNFEDVFKAQQQLQFFRGERVIGEPGLRGGQNISVALQDEVLVNGINNLTTRFALEQSKSELFINRLENQRSSIEKNITSLDKNTQSLEQLIRIFNEGGILQGLDAQAFVANETNRQQNIQRIGQSVASRNQVFDINLNINGQNFKFTGTPEALELVRQEAKRVADGAIDSAFKDIGNNVNNERTKNFNKGLENF